MNHWETMWKFETARFAIRWQITPCEDLDLSWCETGETARNIDDGIWQAFDSRVTVCLDGLEIGADYLGQSIYESPGDFRDHIGLSKTASLSRARKILRQEIENFRAGTAYIHEMKQGYNPGYIARSLAPIRARAQMARQDYNHNVRIAGKCGSYFSDMVSEAIKQARHSLDNMPNLRPVTR